MTLNDRFAGVASTLPAASLARTAKVWRPKESFFSVFRLEQDRNDPPSTLQRKLDPALLEATLNVGVRSRVFFFGPETILVLGGSGAAGVWTVNACLAAVPSLPAASVAFTAKVCEPSDSVEVVNGEAQVANVAPSTEHLKLAPAP